MPNLVKYSLKKNFSGVTSVIAKLLPVYHITFYRVHLEINTSF